MATTAISTSCSQMIGVDHQVGTQRPDIPEQSMLATRLAEAVLRIPPFIQVYCASPTGLRVHGLLRSVSRTGVQVLLPVALPLGGIVQITIAHCRAMFGEAFSRVKRSGVYQMGIVFISRHNPEISAGSVAVIKSLDEPFTLTRGNVLDAGSTRLSIICKTRLLEGAWVRVETSGWILFGLVEAVVATGMVACCVDVRLEAAFPAASADQPQNAQFSEDAETLARPGRQSRECDEDRRPEGRPMTNDLNNCVAGC